MRALPDSLTKEQAIALYESRLATSSEVIYMPCFDASVVFRMGKEDNITTIDIIRCHEDDRPMYFTDKSTGRQTRKLWDLITYQENGLLYALRRSGGVSLFDDLSPKAPRRKNSRWFKLQGDTPIPEGLVVAKHARPDRDGDTHYALQPDEDMLVIELQRRLRFLNPYMQPFDPEVRLKPLRPR
ncbi:MAG: hypothetical protein HY308_17255 [Gammaproteobacteria bacterium]|nr:hypothetical protein [Gammaproteobacteria bacterium]